MSKRFGYYLFLILALVTLAACIPVSEQVTNTYNDRFSDGETVLDLSKPNEFVLLSFTPGESDLVEPVITIVADNLAYNSRECVPNDRGADCFPGSSVNGVRTLESESTFALALSGRNIVATASYRHPGEDRTYSQIAEIR